MILTIRLKKNQQNQREYYLREQIKVIQKELNDDETETEIKEYRKNKNAGIPPEGEEKLYKELDRLAKCLRQWLKPRLSVLI